MCPLGLLVDEKVPLALHSGSGKMRFQLKIQSALYLRPVSAADTDEASQFHQPTSSSKWVGETDYISTGTALASRAQ